MNESPRFHFADNAVIHREIRTMLARFGEPSRSRMRTKIQQDRAAWREQGTAQADAAVRHSYHEFVVGVHLQRLGLSPEYNRRLAGKTPDWFDEHRRLVVEVFTCERGVTAPGPRVAARIDQKVRKYSQTIRGQSLGFVVAVHGDAEGGFTATDCEKAIADFRVFADRPELSGVLFFSDTMSAAEKASDASVHRPAHRFTYFANPAAMCSIQLGHL